MYPVKKTEKHTHHKKEASHHEHKHKHGKHSLHHSSSKKSSKYVNSDSNANNSIECNPSIYTYEKKETQAKYVDYDPHADVSEGYNPEFPELFPSGKNSKIKKLDLESKSSQKRKLKTEEEEYVSKPKKSKHCSNNDLASTDSPKRQEKKQKHVDKDRNEAHKSKSSSLKKESSTSNNAHTEKHKSSSDTKKFKSKEHNKHPSAKGHKLQPKLKLNCSEEFTSSVVKFEDCLGFNDIVTLKKKKSSKSQSAGKKTTTAVVSNNNKSSNSSSASRNIKVPTNILHLTKEKLNISVPKPSMNLNAIDVISTLPEIQPNYKPLPQRTMDIHSPKKKETLTNEDAILFTSSRREKTAVYSGKKSFYTEVPSLFGICTRVLIENIDAIEYMGEVPYYLIKPVLERCSPIQLFNVENYNPYLLEDTHKLWEIHCRRDYRLLSPQENETWRELYLRAHDEREKKLKRLTSNISASMSKSNPVRQVKLAYVDSFVKPPRDVARKQAKNGTAGPVTPTVKAGTSSKATPNVAGPSSSKATPKVAATTMSSVARSSASTSFPPKKPKVAPLMAKTLKSMKQFFRR